MKLSLSNHDLSTQKTDLLGVLVHEGDWPKSLRMLDEALGGQLSDIAKQERFTGKAGSTLPLHTLGKVPARRVLLVGGGAKAAYATSELRHFAATCLRSAISSGCKRVALHAEGAADSGAVQRLVEGAHLGRYRFDRYLSEDKRQRDQLTEIVVLVPGAKPPAKDAVDAGATIAEATCLARDLVNSPASDMTPKDMADRARTVAKTHGLTCKVFGEKECAKLGMGMFLAVARGSVAEPQFIHLHYKPKGKARRSVALVGKGVTFDSGGLSLKPSNAMEDMKIDMSGAAAVIGAMGAIAALELPVEVHGLAACAENMLSGTAYKLGDVLRSMAGKTVEINNTDAEGRLTLGDAITYAKSLGVDEIFDFATLTGACLVALGPHIAGVMSNNDGLATAWLDAARRAGEEMWRLPLPARLMEQLKSAVADMRNTGERYGGALTAGLFLKEFVGETPWVHVDLAGPASSDKDFGHFTKGGTGFGVATIVEYLAAI